VAAAAVDGIQDGHAAAAEAADTESIASNYF
jgi:hypothetical protein